MSKLLAQLEFNIVKEATKQRLPGTAAAASDQETMGFGIFLASILHLAISLGVILVLIYFIWAAVDWITSGGDSGKVASARNKMTQAAIGLLVLSSVLAILFLLEAFLGIDFIKINNFSLIADRIKDVVGGGSGSRSKN